MYFQGTLEYKVLSNSCYFVEHPYKFDTTDFGIASTSSTLRPSLTGLRLILLGFFSFWTFDQVFAPRQGVSPSHVLGISHHPNERSRAVFSDTLGPEVSRIASEQPPPKIEAFPPLFWGRKRLCALQNTSKNRVMFLSPRYAVGIYICASNDRFAEIQSRVGGVFVKSGQRLAKRTVVHIQVEGM